MRRIFTFFVLLSLIGMSNVFAQVNLENGLVAKYYFNGNANDESGNSFNGVVQGATLSTDRFGNSNSAYYFANSDTINAGIIPVFQTNVFSISVWVLEQDISDNGAILGTSRHYSGSDGFTLTYYPTSQYLQFIGQSYPPGGLNNINLNNGNWCNIIITTDGTTSEMFINGVLQSSAASQYYSNNMNFLIGNSESNADVSFLGKIDDIRVYNRVLNSQEIQALYNESNSGNLNNGLVAYYPFNGNANDESGNGINGTVNGATLTSDRFGNVNTAYSFDGISNYIETGVLDVFQGNTFSVSVWVKSYETDGGTILSTFTCHPSTSGFTLTYYNSGQYLQNQEADLYTNLTDGTWKNIIVVCNSSESKIYLNGILKNTTNNIFSPNSLPLLIGWDNYVCYGDVHFNGLIDDIRIYNRAISESEISALYNETPISNLSISTTTTDVTCTSTKNGTATATVTEGTAPYTYLWSNNKTTPTISNLTAGTYNVTVTDANNNSVSAEATVGRIFVCETKVRTLDCGITATNLSKVIYCDNSYGATNYEWEFTATDYSFTRLTGSSNTGFRLSWATGIEYGKTYNVRVRAYKNGMWSNFGTSCEISVISIPVTQLKTLYCGATLNKFSQYIYCDAVVGATDYEWEFANTESNYLFNRTRGNASNSMLLTSITGLEYGKTYDVRIRAKIGLQWGSFGSVCTVTFVVPATQVRADYCGITASSLSKTIYCDAVSGANDYEWQFTNSASNFSVTKSKGSSSTGITLSSISGLQMNTTYEVKVRAKIGQIWGSFANPCSISTPSLPTTQLRDDFCGTTLNSMSQYVFCNAVLFATDYDWEFVNYSTGSVITKTRGIDNNNLLISSVTGLQLSKTYIVRVRAKLNGVWSNYGASCFLSTPTGTTQKSIDENGNNFSVKQINNEFGTSVLELSLIPNPVLKGNSFILSMLSDSKINDCKINVYNIIGQIVYTKQLNIDANNYTLNIEQNEKFSSGLHIVQVEINGNVSRMKMIVE